VAHGGGFIDVAFMGGTLLVGTKDNDDVQALCDTLAHWGYVTACIEYRTGFDVASTTSIKRAVWRGAQDMSAAMRFFRKNAAWFNIDPNRVFIGGSSAGAFCAIHSTFVDNSERIPESLQQSLFMADLGALHSRPVVELTGFNPFTGSNTAANNVDSIPTALVSYWGAIADIAFFAGNNKAPMKMFHGTSDPVVNSRCAQPFASVVLAAPVCCGSEVMENNLSQRNIPNQLSLEQGLGHEYWGALNGMWQVNSPNSYWKPIIQSTADFFYEYMRPEEPIIDGPVTSFATSVDYYNVLNPDPNSDYCWEISGGSIVSSDNGPYVSVVFDPGAVTAYVYCIQRDAADVISLQSSYYVSISCQINTEKVELKNSSINLFPNPASGIVNIVFEEETPNGSIIVSDFLGRELKQIEVNSNNIMLSLEDFEAGNYIVSYKSGKTVLQNILSVK
jgi:dienelactone hydrolase